MRYLLLFLSTYNVSLWNNSLHVFFVLYYPKTILCISPSLTLIFRSFSQPLNLIDYNWIHTVQTVSFMYYHLLYFFDFKFIKVHYNVFKWQGIHIFKQLDILLFWKAGFCSINFMKTEKLFKLIGLLIAYHYL